MPMDDPPANVARDVEFNVRSHRQRFIYGSVAIVVLVLASLSFLWLREANQNGPRFKTTAVERGALIIKVTATGKLEPLTQVDVGTEVSGTIDEVAVDINDRVAEGQILARLDPEPFQAKKRQSQAALNLALASVEEARATTTETESKLSRIRELRTKRLASAEELDTAVAAATRARAALAVAQAKVEQAQAQLDADTRTLDKSVIRSPIKGTVLKRQVEPGQTVAASLQTPVLFTLAEDLTQMELNVAVDEADVGRVREGLQAEFTVDAYPNRRFPARITQVSFAPEIINGVVTYAALLALDNTDLSLRPGMTATAEILVREIKDAILVPNTALRFTPPVGNATKGEDRGLVGLLLPRPPPKSRTNQVKGLKTPKGSRVYVLREGIPEAVDITTGVSDGMLTEVLAGTLGVGTEVVVGIDKRKGSD